jgi:hypothetical protein
MEKEFVTYELALELKQLGFNEPCFGYYVDGELRGINLGMEELGGVEPYYQRFGFHTFSNHDIDNPNKIVVTAPTYSQAFRWFREKYHLIGGIEYIGGQKPTTTWWDIYVIGHFNIDYKEMSMKYQPYEEAELACLQKLIEIVKNK